MREEEIKEIQEFLESKGFRNVEVSWNTPIGGLMLELTVEGSRRKIDPPKQEDVDRGQENNHTLDAFFCSFPHLKRISWGIDFGFPELELTDENMETVRNNVKQNTVEYIKTLIEKWQIEFKSSISNSEFIEELKNFKWNKDAPKHTNKQVCDLLDEHFTRIATSYVKGVHWMNEHHQFKIEKGLVKEEKETETVGLPNTGVFTSANSLYTDYIKERQYETYRVLKAWFTLSKEQMLDTLKNETLICDGIEYNVPETQLLECLMNSKYGLVELELTEVKK